MQSRIAGVVGEVEAGHVVELESSVSSRAGDICGSCCGIWPMGSIRSIEDIEKQ